MKRIITAILIGLCVAMAMPLDVQAGRNKKADRRERARREVVANGRGYYKDVFMNGGINLSSRRTLPSTRSLGLTMEYFATAPTAKMTKKDTLLQERIFSGYSGDTNGPLLYPDGEPRFRMVYFNGGGAARHGASLMVDGRTTMRQYLANGGSYVGSCAGAFIASKGAIRSTDLSIAHVDCYLNLWPGTTRSTALSDSRTAMTIEKGSPLLRYFDFGGDMVVDSIYHNNGCYVYNEKNGIVPAGTVALSRYVFEDTDKVHINGRVGTWGYKHNEQSGRVVVTGSHPEGITKGERLDYMSAMVLYALEGNGAPEPKCSLELGQEREMNKRTEDNAPAHTRIGDRQYHHFVVNIPKGCKRVVISLDGYKGEDKFDLTLCAKRGEMAYHDNTTQKVVSQGCKKSLAIDNPKSGEWYVSVFCETTVTATEGEYGTEYSGRIDVLNGVPYSIKVECE